MGIGARDRRVSHPYLLIGPALLLRAGLHRLAKQGPLRAIGRVGLINQIGRHVPPLDPKIRMRAAIFRKGKNLARNNRRKPFAADAKPGKTLRSRRPAAQPEKHKASRKGAARYRGVTAHWQKS